MPGFYDEPGIAEGENPGPRKRRRLSTGGGPDREPLEVDPGLHPYGGGPPPGTGGIKPIRPPQPPTADTMPEGRPSRLDAATLARRKGGDISGGFSKEEMGGTQQGADATGSAAGASAGGRMKEGGNDQAIAQTIRQRGPEVSALMTRRRGEMKDRFQKYGPTPTGGDPNAPKPPLARRRRAFNAYGGGNWS